MAVCKSDTIRSIALVGHGAAGKTSLAEALLFATGTISAKGSVEKGSTVCDFDVQEKEAGHSLNSAIGNFSYENTHVHLIDTPGYPDFAGQSIAALAGVDTAIVRGQRTDRHRIDDRAHDAPCRRAQAVPDDRDQQDRRRQPRLPGLVADIRERFGKQCMLLDLPAHGAADVVEVLEHDAGDADFESVAAAHRALIDQIVEEDEDLLAQYLEDGADPSAAALHAPFEKALREGRI
jgi:elongation factor G